MSQTDNTARISAVIDTLCRDLQSLRFADPVAHVYNPLDYARERHMEYVNRYGSQQKKIVFLGMNPGPFGMTQTGVPFGEIAAVRDWMGISGPVGQPPQQHPKRPVLGFDCPQSEVSGRRLWGLFAARFDSAAHFFEDHYVANYCPLVFMNANGANLTPDKLPAAESGPLEAICDAHLRALLQIMEPQWAVGVGAFAETCLKRVISSHQLPIRIGKVLHPSPASPAANRGWAEAATNQLQLQGIW
jgi:single-strand selective monofunctional uracil DNA glycosylase